MTAEQIPPEPIGTPDTTTAAISVARLDDAYIRRLCVKQFGIPAAEVTPELIQRKRVLLESKRTVRKINNHLKGALK